MLGFGALASYPIADNDARFVPVTGVAGTTQLGVISIVDGTGLTGFPAGVSATGGTQKVNVWGLVDDSQTANYSDVSTTQTPNWQEVA